MILHCSDTLTSNVWQGSLKWKKNPFLFLLLFIFRIIGNITTIAKFLSHFPHLPVLLTLVQTSDTVDSAHIQISIHLNFLLVAVLWQLLLMSGLTIWTEHRHMTKGPLWHQVCTKEIREYVSKTAKFWQLSNLHTNTFPHDFLLVLLCILKIFNQALATRL